MSLPYYYVVYGVRYPLCQMSTWDFAISSGAYILYLYMHKCMYTCTDMYVLLYTRRKIAYIIVSNWVECENVKFAMLYCARCCCCCRLFFYFPFICIFFSDYNSFLQGRIKYIHIHTFTWEELEYKRMGLLNRLKYLECNLVLVLFLILIRPSSYFCSH